MAELNEVVEQFAALVEFFNKMRDSEVFLYYRDKAVDTCGISTYQKAKGRKQKDVSKSVKLNPMKVKQMRLFLRMKTI